jgi:hypothetical protein
MMVASCLTANALAQQEAKQDVQSSYEPRSARGEGHKLLERMVGNWEVSKVFYPRQGEPVRTTGECRQALIQEGRFLQSEFIFKGESGQTTGLGLIGFETETRRFTSSWVDSRQTRFSVRQGREPFDGRQIVLFSVPLDRASKEGRLSKTISYLDENDRKLIHRQFALGEKGEERLMMELILTRKP